MDFMKLLRGAAGKVKGIADVLGGLSKTQAIIAGVAAVTAVGGVGAGGVALYGHLNQPTEVVVAEIIVETEEEETENVGIVETEAVEVTEETEAAEPEKVNLVGSSIEKDLKIKIQNESSKNVKGQPFEITVKKDQKKAKTSTYSDDDEDGIIYISSIEAGDYIVSLNEIEGYVTEKDTYSVTVKDKIEYVEVEVADEIKDESEVAAGEDAMVEDNIEVEAVLTDTVATLDSTCTPTTVAASEVDTSNFPVASVSGTNKLEITQTVLTASARATSYRTSIDEGQLPSPGGSSEGSGDNGDNGAQTEITYTITHKFYKSDGTTASGKADVVETTATYSAEQSAITAANQSFDGYTLMSGYSTTITTTSGTYAYTVCWKENATAATATVAIPQTVTLYVTTASNANSIALATAITDEGQIVKDIAWASSDATIVALSNEARTGCTLTAKATGTATVTATVTYYSKAGDTKTTATDTVSCTVTVGDYSANTTTQLKDTSGRALYKDAECKIPATIADYAADATYYTDPQYTGWQTIDGKVYYYDANHNKVTGSQVISGITYNFGSDGALQKGTGKNGIDVSSHQGTIDWSAVAASGISFAIIRVGYRGSQTGVLVEDSYFKKNIEGALANGISVGVYFFTQATTEAEAVEEASMALTLCANYTLSYPIFVDTENGSGSGSARANGLDKATRTAVVSAFCKTVTNGGRKAGVYASKNWYLNKIDASAFNSYFIWVAQYNTTCNYTGKYNMWQYSSSGSVAGISGRVDMDIAY